MKTERLAIAVDAPKLDAVSALWSRPSRSDAPERPRAILLAHGAGFHMESPWMAAIAEGLVRRGFPVLRFNYPYRELALRAGKPRPPDRREALEAAHERALEELLGRTGGARPILAGKSLGARISTHLAAKDLSCLGLVLFGYPLHPPKQPEKLRDEHFPAVVQPALFLQGTRDALCDLELLKASLAKYGGQATVAVIEDADHGFSVLARTGLSEAEVRDLLLERALAWDEDAFGRV